MIFFFRIFLLIRIQTWRPIRKASTNQTFAYKNYSSCVLLSFKHFFLAHSPLCGSTIIHITVIPSAQLFFLTTHSYWVFWPHYWRVANIIVRQLWNLNYFCLRQNLINKYDNESNGENDDCYRNKMKFHWQSVSATHYFTITENEKMTRYKQQKMMVKLERDFVEICPSLSSLFLN